MYSISRYVESQKTDRPPAEGLNSNKTKTLENLGTHLFPPAMSHSIGELSVMSPEFPNSPEFFPRILPEFFEFPVTGLKKCARSMPIVGG